MANENTQKSWWKGCGCFFVLFIALGFVAFMVMLGVGLAVLNDTDSDSLYFSRIASNRGGEDEVPRMRETWSYGTGEVKVVRIPVEGIIMLGEDNWQDGNANTVLRSIRRATHDPEVSGLILEVNSGGGGITDSDILYNELKKFKASREDRVIVTLMGDVAASGAYYIAITSDYIMAHPTTLTGSIGVIMQSYNFKELAQKIGIKDVTVKSGENKDLLNPFNDVKPEHKELLQKVISSMHERFVSLVAENRKMDKKAVSLLADGRVFLADEAVTNGLIDGVGYADDARAKMAQLLDVESIKVFKYEEERGFLDLFSHPGIGMNLDLKHLLQGATHDGRLSYRWSW
jgi:protease-4